MLSCPCWSRFGILLFPIAFGCSGSSADLQSPNAPAGLGAEPQSDLTAGPIEAPNQVRLDSLLQMRILVRNQGPRIAGPGWFIRVFLSRDPTIDPRDVMIDQFVASRELAPGVEDRYVRHVKLPGRADPGTYYLISVLDVTHVVPETDEDNNTLRSPMTIRILPRSPVSGGE